MKFGVREICDVVLKAKSTIDIGNKRFYKGEPVIYFDSLKTSTLEGAATTVYAQGGRGNSRLVAWEGERTITFTMEDALISQEGFMILSGAGLVEGSNTKPIPVHTTETTNDYVVKNTDNTYGLMKDSENIASGEDQILLAVSEKPSDNKEAQIYVMIMDEYGDWNSEPYKASIVPGASFKDENGKDKYVISINDIKHTSAQNGYNADLTKFVNKPAVFIDYYKVGASEVKQIEITADKFGGNYYLEASTLFRNTNGVDMPAEFIIPNCKIQSNFTFTMASSGDPSTFTFTMDAFPDYTKFDPTKKVLTAIQIITDNEDAEDNIRYATDHKNVTLTKDENGKVTKIEKAKDSNDDYVIDLTDTTA